MKSPNPASAQFEKSLLAKLMAGENIAVRFSTKATTASFNVETRELVCPTFKDMSKDQYDLFMGHEVGHALFTDSADTEEAMKGKHASFFTFLNVVEDVRIERMIQQRYPGLTRPMFNAYEELVESGFFGDITDKPKLIDRLNIHFKVGSRAGIKFSDVEQKYVDLLDGLRSWDDVVEAADQLYAHARAEAKAAKEAEKEAEEQQDEGASEEVSPDTSQDAPEEAPEEDEDEESDDASSSAALPEEEDEAEEAASAGSDVDSDEDEDDDSEEDSADSESGDDEDEESDSSNDETADMGGTEASDPTDDEDDIDEDDLAADTDHDLSSAFDRDDQRFGDVATVVIPEIRLDSIIEPWTNVAAVHGPVCYDDVRVIRSLKKFKADNKSIINYLIKEFEMKKSADAHSRTLTSTKGTIDTNKLHAYKYDDNIFKQLETISDGLSHGMIFLQDWSGSMVDSGSRANSKFYNSLTQLMVLATFCKAANIPFKAYAFSDRDTKPWVARTTKHEIGSTIAEPHSSVRLFGLFDSNVSHKDFQRQMRMAIFFRDNMGKKSRRFQDFNAIGVRDGYTAGYTGTPLNRSLAFMPQVIREFQNDANVQKVSLVVLTDGQSAAADISPRSYESTLLTDQKTGLQVDGASTWKMLGWVGRTTGATTSWFNIAKHFSAWEVNQNSQDLFNDIEVQMRKEGAAVAKGAKRGGPDEVYFIQTRVLNIQDQDVYGHTAEQVQESFIQGRKDKRKARVFIGSFAALVS
jgi:hypothetical protein